jgi:hypothetical protein
LVDLGIGRVVDFEIIQKANASGCGNYQEAVMEWNGMEMK